MRSAHRCLLVAILAGAVCAGCKRQQEGGSQATGSANSPVRARGSGGPRLSALDTRGGTIQQASLLGTWLRLPDEHADGIGQDYKFSTT